MRFTDARRSEGGENGDEVNEIRKIKVPDTREPNTPEAITIFPILFLIWRDLTLRVISRL